MNAGPYTGRGGWPELREWIREAKRSDPVIVTPERARAIVDACQHSGSVGPWVDQIDRHTTQGEARYLHDVWDAGPGNRSYTDVLLSICNTPQP